MCANKVAYETVLDNGLVEIRLLSRSFLAILNQKKTYDSEVIGNIPSEIASSR